MRKSKDLIFASLINRKAKCKFIRSCNLYSDASYTCSHIGGTYCGKYRKLSHTEKIGVKTNSYLLEIPQ